MDGGGDVSDKIRVIRGIKKMRRVLKKGEVLII